MRIEFEYGGYNPRRTRAGVKRGRKGVRQMLVFHGTKTVGDYSILVRPLYVTPFPDRAAWYAGYGDEDDRGVVLVIDVQAGILKEDPCTPRLCDDDLPDVYIPAGCRENVEYRILGAVPPQRAHIVGLRAWPRPSDAELLALLFRP